MKVSEVLLEAGEAPTFYFSYGMLTDPSLMYGAEKVGVGKLQNFEFELLAHANLIPSGGAVTYGGLWAITRQKLAELDRIEGYPTYYDRKTVPVYVGGKKYEAHVYTMTPESRELSAGSHPTKEYIMRIAKGYKSFGIPTQQVVVALEKLAPKEKAGLIPYCKIRGQVKFMFMISSNPNFGGPDPAIAKGEIDPGESSQSAAFREAQEELGLKLENLVSSPKLIWQGDMTGKEDTYPFTVYAAEVKNPADFGPHDKETARTVWLTADEFEWNGRPEHRKIVQLAASKIGIQT